MTANKTYCAIHCVPHSRLHPELTHISAFANRIYNLVCYWVRVNLLVGLVSFTLYLQERRVTFELTKLVLFTPITVVLLISESINDTVCVVNCMQIQAQ